MIPMLRRPFVIGAAVAIAAVSILGWFAFVRANRPQEGITTEPVVSKTFAKTIESSGKTKAKHSARLTFQTSGRLSWVGVSEGDAVTRGQVIAGLDTREVQKTLKKYLTDYSKQRNDFEEMWRVTYKGTQDPQKALTDTAKRILEKNQWDLDKAVLDVELKALAVEYAALASPVDGIVINLTQPIPGVNITAADVIAEVADPGSLVFEATIDEVDVGQLVVGQNGEIHLDAFPDRSFSARISRISYASETSSAGATVFPVELSFDASEAVRIGLNGDVTITTQTIDHAVVVPAEAIQVIDANKFVYKKIGTTYQKTTVQTGPTTDEETVVTDGLSAGDEVVVKGFGQIPL